VESDPIELTELVRGNLSRQICFPLAHEEGTLLVHTVDGEIQQAIRESIRRTETGSYLGLPPDMQDEILAATRRAVSATSGAAPKTSPAGTARGTESVASGTTTALSRAVTARGGAASPSSEAVSPVLLVDPDVRPHLRSLLEHEFPHIVVLSMRELPPELLLGSIGTITVTGDPILLDD
jgi:flagellar biosynthesis protein FlhA